MSLQTFRDKSTLKSHYLDKTHGYDEVVKLIAKFKILFCRSEGAQKLLTVSAISVEEQ